MDITVFKKKLENKTFLFKIGNYNNIGGAETNAIDLAEFLKKYQL